MKYRLLCVIPLAFGLIHLFFYFLLSGQDFSHFVYYEIIVVKLLAFLGGLAAAVKFKRGDYLRFAWLYIGGSTLLYAISDIFFVSIMPNMIGITKSNIIRGILVAIGNLIFIIGIWMLARTWTSVVGLSFPGRLWAKRLIIGAAILVTLFLVVPSVIRGLQGSLSGNFGTWDLIVNMVSGLGDLIALSLIAPILLTALALRGGLLKWPWLFLTCILGSWLIYDGVHSWAPNLGLSPAEILGYANFFRVVACLYTVSAGLSQRFIMEGFHRQK